LSVNAKIGYTDLSNEQSNCDENQVGVATGTVDGKTGGRIAIRAVVEKQLTSKMEKMRKNTNFPKSDGKTQGWENSYQLSLKSFQ
jgi:hypothetical protein